MTVSENSKRDIIELLGVEERRITNTYEAVHFPAAYGNGRRRRSPSSWRAPTASNSTNICCFSGRWSRRRMSAA